MNDPRFSFLTSVSSISNIEAVAEFLRSTKIQITVSPEVNTTFSGQVLVYQLATLLTRLFDHIELIGDEEAQCHTHLSLLSGPFLPALRNLLPTLRCLGSTPSPSKVVNVVVGTSAEEAHIFLGAGPWSAKVSRMEPQSITEALNPIGSLAAGALGASEVFKEIFRDQLQGAIINDGYILSLLDYSHETSAEPLLPDQLSIDATLFGCGSIGCGFLQGALLVPQLHGKLVTVDNGRFDEKNPYKYSLVDWATGTQGPFKAVWTQQQTRSFTTGRLKAEAFVGTAESYVATLTSNYRIPLAISAVDTIEARFEIQDTLPQTIVNAGVDGTLAMVSTHNFGSGPCLACLGMQSNLESWNAKTIAEKTGLSPERVYELIRGNEAMTTKDIDQIKARNVVKSELLRDVDTFVGQPLLSFWNRVAYSETTLQIPTLPPVKITTAFVSAFAGVLLLAEVIKTLDSSLQAYRVNNSYQQQLLGIPAGGIFQYQREPNGWCLCHSSYRQMIYKGKYGNT
jgi:hypothetical protein